MTKKNVQKAMELTIESLNHFWKQDINFVLSLCAEDVYWLGSIPNQFYVWDSCNDRRFLANGSIWKAVSYFESEFQGSTE